MEFAIEIKQLTKVYEGKVNALDGVDLSVKAAGIFALLGPNGWARPRSCGFSPPNSVPLQE